MVYKSVIVDTKMKSNAIIFIIALVLLACNGCASSSMHETIAAIEHAENTKKNMVTSNTVLDKIQNLRRSVNSNRSSYKFNYQLNTKELNNDDKLIIARLVGQKNITLIINIAPANGTNKIDQLALSMERAKKLQLYINHFDSNVKIRYAPSLSTDTMTIVTGV